MHRRQVLVSIGATALVAATAPVAFQPSQGIGRKFDAIRHDGGTFRDMHFVLRRGEQVSLSGLRDVHLHTCRFTWIGEQPDQCLDLREATNCTVIDCHFSGKLLNFRIDKITP